MTRAESLAELIALIEAGGGISWGYAAGPARTALGDLWHSAMEAYCGSIDAAKALHDAVLPGWGYCVKHFTNGQPRAAVAHYPYSAQYTEADSPARAWLLAILRAMHAMEGGQP
jgi:hypothetical protein